jgi:hypothetical protein
MKAIFSISAVAVLLAVAPSPCFAEFLLVSVSTERAKDLGIEVRSQPAGPNLVRVELEFKAEGELKNFSLVNLRLGEGDNPLVTAPLQEDRSKPGRVMVSFTVDRAQLPKLNLRVMVPGGAGGSIYDLQVRDFVR